MTNETPNEVARLRRVVEAQDAALMHWRRDADRDYIKQIRLSDALRLAIPILKRHKAEAVLSQVEDALAYVNISATLLPKPLQNLNLSKLRSPKYQKLTAYLTDFGPKTVKTIATDMKMNVGTAYNLLRRGEQHSLYQRNARKEWEVCQ